MFWSLLSKTFDCKAIFYIFNHTEYIQSGAFGRASQLETNTFFIDLCWQINIVVFLTMTRYFFQNVIILQ